MGAATAKFFTSSNDAYFQEKADIVWMARSKWSFFVGGLSFCRDVRALPRAMKDNVIKHVQKSISTALKTIPRDKKQRQLMTFIKVISSSGTRKRSRG